MAGQEGLVLGQGVAGAVGDEVLGQHHGQVLFRDGNRTAIGAVDDGDRGAPVALAGNAPVAQAPGGAQLAQALGLQVGGHGLDRLGGAQAIILAGLDRAADLLVGVPVLPGLGGVGLAFGGDDLADGQAVLAREGEVALIVGGHAHDGAVAVAHEDVVADPHRHGFAREGVDDGQAGGQAFLFARGQFGLGGAALAAGLDEGGQLGVAARRAGGQRVFRRHGAEGDAHDGVGARREDVHQAVLDQPALFVADVVAEGEAHALALADPVFLHQAHAFRPAGQAVLEGVEQFARVVGDAQVVAGDLALFHGRAGAPAAAVDDLLVGEHGLVDRVPVDGLGLAVGDALFQHLQEQPLVPLVVGRVAGAHFARPVDRQPHRLHLLLHVGDVVVGPLGRGDAGLHGGVFRRHAEGVPAHGHEDVVPAHAQLAGHHVVDGVVAHVTHVELAAGVGQHRAGVELGLGRAVRKGGVFGDAVDVARAPVGLGFGFDLVREVAFLHGSVWEMGVERASPTL